MVWRKTRWILFSLLAILVICIAFFERVDRTPYTDLPYFQQAKHAIDSVTDQFEPSTSDTLRVGWSQRNITPLSPAHLMGYGWKGDYEQVHDSLWVRTMVLQMDSIAVGVVAYDLMLTPPAVVALVREAVNELPIDHLYFTAIHTHNGYGGWVDGIGRELIAGRYSQELVQYLSDQTVLSLKDALAQTLPTTLAYSQIATDSMVNNRLIRGGDVEPYLRTIFFRRSDSSQAVLSSYSAHATYITSKSKDLSADYPGELVRQLESQASVEFALFAAGAVGSHSPHKPGPFSYKKLQEYASQLSEPIAATIDTISYRAITSMGFAEIPVPLGEAQLRITANWRVRPFWFRIMMGDMRPTITLLQLGDMILVGTPGDFSGLLYDQLQPQGNHLIVTSFNGEYIGYLIPSQYYGINHRETRITNWFGPFTGDYITELINRSLRKIGTPSPTMTD